MTWAQQYLGAVGETRGRSARSTPPTSYSPASYKRPKRFLWFSHYSGEKRTLCLLCQSPITAESQPEKRGDSYLSGIPAFCGKPRPCILCKGGEIFLCGLRGDKLLAPRLLLRLRFNSEQPGGRSRIGRARSRSPLLSTLPPPERARLPDRWRWERRPGPCLCCHRRGRRVSPWSPSAARSCHAAGR
jgi:hypothetical protein